MLKQLKLQFFSSLVRDLNSARIPTNMSFFSAIFDSLFVTPILTILSIIFLASLGKSFGVRRFYIKVLLKIFEVSKIEKLKWANQQQIRLISIGLSILKTSFIIPFFCFNLYLNHEALHDDNLKLIISIIF